MLNRALGKLRRLLRPAATPPGVNPYWRQLDASEIAAGEHRAFVGGYWEEVGRSQSEFMRRRGLRPEHKLVDVGCGALRGGLHFIRYLDAGNYFGIDLNESLIRAGEHEVAAAGLADKRPNLLVNGEFDISRFGVRFDYAVAVSLFTHLYMNSIARCLVETGRGLKRGGSFYATFFEAPRAAHLEPITHGPGGVTTNFDSDPFHYALAEMRGLAGWAGMTVELCDDWQHPRGQGMLCFSKS